MIPLITPCSRADRRVSHSIKDLGGDRKAGEERTQTNILRPCMMDNNRLSSSSGIILKQEKIKSSEE